MLTMWLAGGPIGPERHRRPRPDCHLSRCGGGRCFQGRSAQAWAPARATQGLNMRGIRALETKDGGYEAGARHAQVLGGGPRIDSIPNEEIDAEAWTLVNQLRASAGAP